MIINELLHEDPQAGDSIDLEFGDVLVETSILEVTEDGIVVQLDETAMQMILAARKQYIAESQQGVAEGLDPEKRARLDDLIDQFRDSTDPNDYYDRDYSDPEDVVAMIRAEFGDRIADEVAAGADKMHFSRPGHTSWKADPLGWKKPVDRMTKAGKMYKQDSDFRKNTIKSRYKLSGKSATEGVAEESDKLQGTPVVSLSDFDDRDYKKNKYGQNVPRKLKPDDPRVKFHKEPKKQGVAETILRNPDGSIRVVDHKRESKELNVGDTFEYGFFGTKKGTATVVKIQGFPGKEFIVGKTIDGKISKFPYRGAIPKNGYYIKKIKSIDNSETELSESLPFTTTEPDKDNMVTVGFDAMTGEPIRKPGPPRISTSWRISQAGREFLKQAYEDIKSAFNTGGESEADAVAKAYSDAQMEKFPSGSTYNSRTDMFTMDIKRIYDKVKDKHKRDEYQRYDQVASSSGPLMIGGDSEEDLSQLLSQFKQNWGDVVKFFMSTEGRNWLRSELKKSNEFSGWRVSEVLRYIKDCISAGVELDKDSWKQDQIKENLNTVSKSSTANLFAKILQKATNQGVAEGYINDRGDYVSSRSGEDPHAYDKYRQSKLDKDNAPTKTIYRVWDGKKYVGDKKFNSVEDAKAFRASLPGGKDMSITTAKIYVNEAEYQGRKVPLGKPMAGDVKKKKVYVKGPKGNVVKVNFGDKNMRIKKSNPKRRKSFRARHRCDNPGPRWKARYWSCRAW